VPADVFPRSKEEKETLAKVNTKNTLGGTPPKTHQDGIKKVARYADLVWMGNSLVGVGGYPQGAPKTQLQTPLQKEGTLKTVCFPSTAFSPVGGWGGTGNVTGGVGG